MDPWWVAIAVAVIGGPVMWFLNRLDRRNTSQHQASLTVLEETRTLVGNVDSKVDKLEAKVDNLDDRIFSHVENHEKGPFVA